MDLRLHNLKYKDDYVCVTYDYQGAPHLLDPQSQGGVGGARSKDG